MADRVGGSAGPLVSIVICTRNRARQLRPCLDAIARVRSNLPWELVIVDNGSTDDTAKVIADFARQATFPVVPAVEPVAGLGRARNVGWRAARGEFIAFTDDDCYVGEDFVDQAAALFSVAEIGYGGGRLTLFDPSDHPVALNLKTTRQLIPPHSYVEAGLISGANMVFRRVVLEQIGGFDPIFGPGGKYVCDDVDAQARASFAGWVGVFEPALTVAHHHGRDATAARKLNRTYGVGRGAYFMKFLLRRDSRYEFARHIYWQARSAPWIDIARDAEGASGYLVSRAWAWRE
ncbi:MAG: glycosyltransferase family 2 protein [Stellaceae bacterium]